MGKRIQTNAKRFNNSQRRILNVHQRRFDCYASNNSFLAAGSILEILAAQSEEHKREAIKRCAPYQMQMYDDQVTVYV